MELDPKKSIPAFYAGRSIFITGGTGFMGKVLIEKLLRSCPDVAEIFLLMRPKKNIPIDDRLRKMITLPIFDKLREENPDAFKKLIPVSGDVAEEGLGLPTIERRVLIEKVSVVFHVAASVRFDDPFKQAVFMNTRGTREACVLATAMKKLVAFLYVSTTYGNIDKPVIDEIIYPAHADWKKVIKTAETLDENLLNTMTAKYIDKLPNTYTFTKQLAESVVNDYAKVIPSVIFRPSVVVPTFTDPFTGWMDNFNGPIGLLIGGGKGIMRCLYADSESSPDYIPVDIATKGLIFSAWERGIKTITKDPSLHVINCAANGIKRFSNHEVMVMGFRISKEFPMKDIIWFPATAIYSSKSIYYLSFLVFQLLPALLIDTALKLSGEKPRLVKLQRKIFTANMALGHFMMHEWKFMNDKLMNFTEKLSEADRPNFGIDFLNLDVNLYFRNCMIGAKKYLLNESLDELEKDKAHYNKMWWIDRISKTFLTVTIAWASVTYGILPSIFNTVTSAFDVSL